MAETSGRAIMAENINNFLHYGSSPAALELSSPSIAENFLPSLVLHASDDPSIAPSLLFPFVEKPQTPKAMSYASLDFDQVRQLILSEEQKRNETEESGKKSTESDYWERDWGLSNQHYSEDECLAFEAANEINRAKIVITSLRKCTSEFSCIIDSGTNTHSWWFQQCKSAGNIWSSEALIPDLLCLLPIAVSRCPDLLEPEILVKGLLTARSGGALLLSAVLINNPLMRERCLILLADFISKYLGQNLRDPFYPNISSVPDNTVPGEVPKDASYCELNPVISECVHHACWVFVLLCQSVPQLAFTCREALVKRCTFADMVIYITLELLHDELEFFSRIIFSDKKTSKWILRFISLRQKNPISFLPRLNQTNNLSKRLKEINGVVVVPYPNKDTERIVQCVQRALLDDAKAVFHEKGWGASLHGHLRLYCVLVRAGDLQPTHEEVNFWLHALGGKTTKIYQKTISERMLQLGIAFLCLVPGLPNSSTKCLYYACIMFLLGPAIFQLESLNQGREVAVWLVVQLLLRHYPDIAMFVRDTVGMDIVVHNSSIKDLCEAAAATGITSNPTLVVKAAAALRPLCPINSSKKTADLLLTCFCQLMLAGVFISCAVDISEVVMQYISLSAEPIHPMLVQLVRMFAESSSLCHKGEMATQEFRMQPLPFSFLATSIDCISTCKNPLKEKTSFSGECYEDSYAFGNAKSELMASAVLSTFYVLCREQLLQNSGLYVGYVHGGSAPIHLKDSEDIQWSKLLTALPLLSILTYMEDHWIEYEHLLPQWLSLASSLFPERLLVSKLLENSEESDSRSDLADKGIPVIEDLEWVGGYEMILSSSETNQQHKTGGYCSKSFFSVDIVSKIFRNALTQPLPALKILKVIQVESAENIFDVQSLVMSDLVPLLLEDSCPRPLQKYFCDWWRALSHGESELLVPHLFNSIRIMDIDKDNNCKLQKLKASLVRMNLLNTVTSYAELAQEPLALLACKDRVYRTPLLSILLDLLMELLVKNRKICLGGISERIAGFKQQEILGALAAQESAVCQILLEACLQNPLLGDDVEPGPMLEARQLICAFISSLLDTCPDILKLLHFQGYEIQLVPMMMDGISSMVQCFEFVQELLQKTHEWQQMFAVVLISNLVKRYPDHPQSLVAAKQVVEHVKFLRNRETSTPDILKEMLEPVVWCAISFPSMAVEVTALLQDCLKVDATLEQSISTSDHVLHDSAVSAFRLFTQKKVLPGTVFS